MAIVAIQKMEERLAADTEENIDNQLLTEVSSRVIGNLRRRADGRNDVESSIQEENPSDVSVLPRCVPNAPSCIICAPHEKSAMKHCKSCCTTDLMEALLIENQ